MYTDRMQHMCVPPKSPYKGYLTRDCVISAALIGQPSVYVCVHACVCECLSVHARVRRRHKTGMLKQSDALADFASLRHPFRQTHFSSRVSFTSPSRSTTTTTSIQPATPPTPPQRNTDGCVKLFSLRAPRRSAPFSCFVAGTPSRLSKHWRVNKP